MALDLTFAELQRATNERGKAWGAPGLQFRGLELAGENAELLEQGMYLAILMMDASRRAGKAVEALKKIVRFQEGMKGGSDDRTALREEIGDAAISLALLCNELGEDFAAIVTDKFNKTSDKYGFDVKLPLTQPSGVAAPCRLN